MRLSICPYMLKFHHPARTSRGVLTEKPTYLLKIYDERHPEVYGLGEAAVFPGLSPEADHRYEYKLIELLANIAIGRPTDLSRHSSIRFGLEQALRDFSGGGRRIYWPSEFTAGERALTINGLVWMGDIEEMRRRLREKVDAGFKCVKLKIGALDIREELRIIEEIRREYSPEQLTVRVDANGGLTMDQAMPVLQRLADLGVHSIEQPIPAGNPDLMKFLCQVSPCPIALDEELIGVSEVELKRQLLDYIRPAYVILKPALCGGFSGAEEWIAAAGECGAGWWVTSALESNVGLNAIAQWTASLGESMAADAPCNPYNLPQGLGTGGLFTNNFELPVHLEGESLRFNPDAKIDDAQFDSLDWKD